MGKKAMILAAGKGTRLGNLTREKPKALVPVYGVPMLEIVLQKLYAAGVHEVVINIHHQGSQIKNFLINRKRSGMTINISEEKEYPLETGGGIRHAADLLRDVPYFLVHNVDILTDLNMRQLMEKHIVSQAMVTLAVSRRETSRYLLADEQFFLCGWENTTTGEQIMVRNPEGEMTRWGFSGIQVISREVLSLLPDEEVFSLTHFYLDMARNHPVKVFTPNMSFWFDMGKPGVIERIETTFSKDNIIHSLS